MDVVPCIFCGIEDDLTDEHVFPAFMGGTLSVRNGSCAPHNSLCSRFEDKVASATQVLRNLLGVENRKSIVPNAAVTMSSEGFDFPAMRTPDGDVIPRDFVHENKTADGIEKRGFFTSEAPARKFGDKARLRGASVQTFRPAPVTARPTAMVPFEFAFASETLRTVAKIALAAVAYEYGSSYALTARFDKLRSFILGLEPTHRVTLFANPEVASDHLRSPLQHCVRAYLSADRRRGWAVVSLFGGLCYVVELTDTFDEPRSRMFSIFFDAQIGKIFAPIVLYDEQGILGRVLSTRTAFDTVDALHAQWFPILDEFCRSKGIDIERRSGSLTP